MEINSQEIKNICEDFFQKIGVPCDIFLIGADSGMSVKIKVDNPKILIGYNGRTLAAIQRVLTIIVKKKVYPGAEFSEFYLDFDVNDYKKEKECYLREIAQAIADEVILAKEERELPPMPAHERKIIHLELAERQGVSTESTGNEKERRIVVKPKEEKNE